MLISLLVFLIVSNAVYSRRDKSILFSRIVMTSLGFSSLLLQSWLKTMLISLLVFLIASNAVYSRRYKSILFSRIVMISLVFSSLLALNNFYMKALEEGADIYMPTE